MYQPNQTFEASVFHPALGNEVATGIIVIDRNEVHFESEAITLDIPMHRLRVRVGEGEDERIYFQDSESPEWEVFTSDFDILEHPLIPQMRVVRDRLSRAATNQEVIKRLKVVGYVVAFLVLVIWMVDVAADLALSALVARVPPQLEQKLGKEALAELRQEMTFIEDSNRLYSLQVLVAPLTNAVALGTNALTLFIADEEEPNACALPGGYVVVNTGLLKLVDRPEELLGVLAHELAHVKRKHGIRRAISGAGPFLMFGVLLGGRGGVVGLLGSATGLLFQSGFSQEYETEADDMAWQMMLASKVDPRGMTEAFRKMRAYEIKQDIKDDMPQAFSSHPALEKRIARMEKKWKKVKARTEFTDLSPLEKPLQTAAGN